MIAIKLKSRWSYTRDIYWMYCVVFVWIYLTCIHVDWLNIIFPGHFWKSPVAYLPETATRGVSVSARRRVSQWRLPYRWISLKMPAAHKSEGVKDGRFWACIDHIVLETCKHVTVTLTEHAVLSLPKVSFGTFAKLFVFFPSKLIYQLI